MLLLLTLNSTQLVSVNPFHTLMWHRFWILIKNPLSSPVIPSPSPISTQCLKQTTRFSDSGSESTFFSGFLFTTTPTYPIKCQKSEDLHLFTALSATHITYRMNSQIFIEYMNLLKWIFQTRNVVFLFIRSSFCLSKKF